MTENEQRIPEGWETGYREGHYTKTLNINNCTVRVHRPILDDQERAKREDAVKQALIQFGKESNYGKV